MQESIVILGQWGPLTLTAYGLCLLGGAVLAVLATLLLSRRSVGVDGALSMSLCAMAGAFVGARLLYCLTMLEFILVDLGGPGFLLEPWQGGYTMYGAILGGMAALAIYARATHRGVGQVLDLAAPGAAIAMACGRLGEYFTTQGLGHYVYSESLWRFPFAVEGGYGDWQLPVFAYEAFAALVVLAVCLRMLRKGKAGLTAEVFLTLISLSQVLLESLRADEFIRFGFVRFNMLAAALTLGGVMALRLRELVKRHGWKKGETVRTIVFALGVAMAIAIEFALDKTPVDNRLLYAIDAAFLTAMGFSILWERKA